MGEISRFSFPTAIAVGVGAGATLVDVLKKEGLSRPMIVTDKGLAALPIVGTYCDGLAKGGLSPILFSELWGNPVKSQVTAGVEHYRDNNADAIVGFGGGAAMDVAKAIALMVHHEGDLFDYEDGKPDALPVDKDIPYLAMVPTTAGTGSEVGRALVVSDDVTKVKKIIFDPRLMPKIALLDPTLSLGLPPQITATTGLDALCHLVEAYVAPGSHPMADGIALEGIRLIEENLVKAVGHAALQTGQQDAYPAAVAAVGAETSEEDHIQVRTQMLLAAMMGAVAFQKGLGATHSCAHALSTVCDLHHGLANGILMPYVMRYNLEAVPERFVNMARAARLQEERAEAFVGWLVALQMMLEVPRNLKDAGVKVGQIEELSDHAFRDGCHQSNPRPCTRDDLRRLFVSALGAEGKV